MRSPLVQECGEALKSYRSTEIELVWVPGHCGIQGKQKADELARHGPGNGAMDEPEPYLGITRRQGGLRSRNMSIREAAVRMFDLKKKDFPELSTADQEGLVTDVI
ncbi:hypothetical protein NQ317_007600 [Molorchus minor]|uniref:RNase H type-1 domain-containing protein n=1 Tax=Molorchus minor TaxID=1323400 RepID=A0ABQ9IRD7_9CUCU|nr:hypothetical protein NQ317_007600 [Molorchus minor]